MNSAVIALKRALRKDIKNRLRAVTPDVIAAECNSFHSADARAAETLSVFLLSIAEKNCYVPRWTADAMEMVKIASWEEYLSLPVNRWNIPEPPHDRHMENAFDAEGLDLVIMPAMGFDEERNRIGHGKG
ncbi:5-formyltetrahydrofolate cyclo-ligase [Dichotomocladium elegans]|nr:5-formyltetrahydrofolate cyclo-ligase [Dichotomocladium elegans]